jgi:hypothetical protein
VDTGLSPPQPWGRTALILRSGCDSYDEESGRGIAGRREDKRAPARPGNARASALFGNDVDGEVHLDVGVQFHGDLDRAELLEGLGELRLAAVELDAGLGTHRVDDVG